MVQRDFARATGPGAINLELRVQQDLADELEVPLLAGRPQLGGRRGRLKPRNFVILGLRPQFVLVLAQLIYRCRRFVHGVRHPLDHFNLGLERHGHGRHGRLGLVLRVQRPQPGQRVGEVDVLDLRQRLGGHCDGRHLATVYSELGHRDVEQVDRLLPREQGFGRVHRARSAGLSLLPPLKPRELVLLVLCVILHPWQHRGAVRALVDLTGGATADGAVVHVIVSPAVSERLGRLVGRALRPHHVNRFGQLVRVVPALKFFADCVDRVTAAAVGAGRRGAERFWGLVRGIFDRLQHCWPRARHLVDIVAVLALIVAMRVERLRRFVDVLPALLVKRDGLGIGVDQRIG